jgi:hypothetical protein
MGGELRRGARIQGRNLGLLYDGNNEQSFLVTKCLVGNRYLAPSQWNIAMDFYEEITV